MIDYNGAFKNYDDSTRQTTFFRASTRYTKSVTVKQGQVLKAKSFLETDTEGKSIAHSGINEIALITFPATIDTGETVIIAGLTFTAGTNATTTQAQLKAAWEGLTAGMTAAQANTAQGAAVSAAIGTFTAGTLTGYNTEHSPTTGAVLFRSTTPYAGVSDLTVTGTGDASTVAVTAVNDPQKKPSGVLIYDVDATSADVVAEAWCEASFYASALIWSVDPAVDTITLFDGSTVACTPYNTGCTTDLLKQKFVESTGFSELGFVSAGETYNV